MTSQPYVRFGITQVVNAVGYATRVGGSCPDEEVLQAMVAANQAYVEIDDVQAAASKLIAQSTGAEAGIVTCGAAAGLALAAAACLAGNAPDLMERLPDVSGMERVEIVYPHVGPYDYDHPLRATGARLVHLDYQGDDALPRIESAINSRTAAIGYNWRQVQESPSIRELASLAHRHHLPLIVDGAMSLPPVSNLRYFTACGADLATFSGGKHIGGPQASGILCGRQDLIRSAWVQMVDMDVRVPTWSLRAWIAEGWITRAPRHGIGRGMKVGKEAIIGLMWALERYMARDHDAEYAHWEALIATIEVGLQEIPGLHLTRLRVATNGQPFPVLRLYCDRETLGLSTQELINRLRELRPKIVLAEDEDERGATVAPMCLDGDQAEYIVTSIRQMLPNRVISGSAR